MSILTNLGIILNPILILLCYMIGEAWKLVLIKDKETKEAIERGKDTIPMLVSFVGLTSAAVCYTFIPGSLAVDNILFALGSGLASALIAVGLNQLGLKTLRVFKRED